MPKTARSMPSGNGAVIRLPLTKCFSPTGMRAVRPGRAWSAAGMRSFLELVKNIRPVYGAAAEWLLSVSHDGGVSPRDLRQHAQGLAQPGPARDGRRGPARRDSV